MPVREYDQVSTRNFDFLFLAFDFKPTFSSGNRVKAAHWLPIHAKRPRPAEIRPTVESATNVQVREHVVEGVLSRELVQKFQEAVGTAAIAPARVFVSRSVSQPAGRMVRKYGVSVIAGTLYVGYNCARTRLERSKQSVVVRSDKSI